MEKVLRDTNLGPMPPKRGGKGALRQATITNSNEVCGAVTYRALVSSGLLTSPQRQSRPTGIGNMSTVEIKTRGLASSIGTTVMVNVYIPFLDRSCVMKRALINTAPGQSATLTAEDHAPATAR